IVSEREPVILEGWLDKLDDMGVLHTGRISDQELRTQAQRLLELLHKAVSAGRAQIDAAPYQPVRELLGEISRSRAMQGFSPRETAQFVFALRQPLHDAITASSGFDAQQLAEASLQSTLLLDALGLYTMEAFHKSREEVIVRQQREIAELSTPVVKLWEGVLALPLIGTLDSERTQVVMENLLQSIVDQAAVIAIIDITGVPTVDTLTAQHLLKTVAAARLMGADCIVSGIRPQIAQTMVHLGVELNVVSKATLADALALALRRVNRTVVPIKAEQRA
ncbi:MAG TPA: STAS domain-containing protein, partial [Steroidobacter sp.]|nr:STAS domain-containing protein [Steroidobacter sp.]